MPPKKKVVAKAAPKKVTPKKKAVKPQDDDEEEEEEEEEEDEAPKKKSSPKGKGKKSGGVDWQAMLDSLESGGITGNILFPKSGKTRIKLVLEDDDDEESWYTEVQGEFQGRVRSRFILRGVVLFPAQEEKKILGIVVAKTAMKQIVSALAEGYNLTDAEEGHGITLSKTGSELNTTWGATPSPKPVEIEDFDEYEDDDSTLEELEKQLEEIAAKRAGSTKKKGKKDSEGDEDEDEDEDW